MQTSKRMFIASLFIIVRPGNNPSTGRFTSEAQHIHKAESRDSKKKQRAYASHDLQ